MQRYHIAKKGKKAGRAVPLPGQEEMQNNAPRRAFGYGSSLGAQQRA